ncbi:MAG: DUF432 domain-containing protein [Archaeoglobus sp.]|nr:DUF432 domain-containing protein [Archaeoglobus sp.]
MYGYYELSEFSIKFGEIKVRIEEEGNAYRYVREGRERKEKVILGRSGRLIVNPVEPVNLPKELTNFLQIKFKETVISEPKSSMDVYLTFPIEVGVFLAAKKNVDILDVFSLNNPKFSLYGNPRDGIICRYWESRVFNQIPDVDHQREGVLRLKVTNESNEWAEISTAVFDIFGMKIYFDEKMVASKASMNIENPRVAGTNFIARPLAEGMKKALELYTARKIPMVGKKFVMEWGY